MLGVLVGLLAFTTAGAHDDLLMLQAATLRAEQIPGPPPSPVDLKEKDRKFCNSTSTTVTSTTTTSVTWTSTTSTSTTTTTTVTTTTTMYTTPGTTTSRPPSTPGFCMIFGDPHFTTFDNQEIFFEGQKDVWAVKSSDVSVQIRSVKRTGNTQGVAVSGSFMGGMKFSFEQFDDPTARHVKVKYNGNDITDLQGAVMPKTWDSGDGNLNGQIRNGVTLPDVDKREFFHNGKDKRDAFKTGATWKFVFPKGVTLHIALVDYLTVVLEMPPIAAGHGGQAGWCGNFDGDATNDEPQAADDMVASGASAFASPAPPSNAGQVHTRSLDDIINDCSEPNKNVATTECKRVNDVTIKGCLTAATVGLKYKQCFMDVCLMYENGVSPNPSNPSPAADAVMACQDLSVLPASECGSAR